jgi:predicted glycosyltransferase
MKVMIVVTHLLGTGHLARALTLARGFIAAGHEACVASGGMPAPQLDRGDVPVLQLPPVRSDGVDFSRLLDASGDSLSAEDLANRSALLREHLERETPDVLITELFPFGRRILRAEFGALLESAHALPKPPLICASIRDILAPPSKPEKAVKADAIIAAYYDAVLVHADGAVTPLELSWPVSETLAPKLIYTGFVAPAPAPPSRAGRDEIIVSAGGGDVGEHVFAAAVDAAAHDNRVWRILLGGADAAKRADALAKSAPANVVIEPARPDFRGMLYNAAASVSLCGYNTALDILQSGCAAVFVPFDAGQEVEQSIRAQALGVLEGIAVLPSADLSASSLLAAVETVTSAPPRAPALTGFDGAAETVRIVQNLQEARG